MSTCLEIGFEIGLDIPKFEFDSKQEKHNWHVKRRIYEER